MSFSNCHNTLLVRSTVHARSSGLCLTRYEICYLYDCDDLHNAKSFDACKHICIHIQDVFRKKKGHLKGNYYIT